ncbi:hypothetical protein FGO68_gene5286 [Halteria grandinella]|uniref:Uncharacterized protein n=1 Tax=Halteria grandinella TaxID=5974 RepID=A0A8J8T290_HALGN|nr:hypothetical protein FGO68_gene5286 [Halteria grandinella]
MSVNHPFQLLSIYGYLPEIIHQNQLLITISNILKNSNPLQVCWCHALFCLQQPEYIGSHQVSFSISGQNIDQGREYLLNYMRAFVMSDKMMRKRGVLFECEQIQEMVRANRRIDYMGEKFAIVNAIQAIKGALKGSMTIWQDNQALQEITQQANWRQNKILRRQQMVHKIAISQKHTAQNSIIHLYEQAIFLVMNELQLSYPFDLNNP